MKYVRKGAVEAVKTAKGNDNYKALTGKSDVVEDEMGLIVYHDNDDVVCAWGRYLVLDGDELYSMTPSEFELRYEAAADVKPLGELMKDEKVKEGATNG
jgi:hypothetical protein